MKRDFWKFWIGQTVSNVGNAVTLFALPLLIFKLTGSAFSLGLMTAAEFLPYLLFGLVIGAWVDRVDRRRLMIAADATRAALVASIRLLAAVGHLSLWWVYAAGFLGSTLAICFNAAEFAAIPSLVPAGELVAANGRIQASYAAATVAGPLLGGVLIAVVRVEDVLLLDTLSFVASVVSLALIRTSFNAVQEERPSLASLRRDIVEGLRYVLGHPVLRNISLMMALINFVGTTTYAQLVLFAKDRLHASDPRVSLLFAAGSVGTIALSLAAGPLRRRWSFSVVALGALMLNGLLLLGFGLTRWYWGALLLWAVASGAGVLFNINTGSLRQTIAPNHMLGRVMSIAMVLAFSANPLGALAGGFLIQRSGDIALVYAGIGGLTFLVACAFTFTPLGHAERFLPPAAAGTVSDGLPALEIVSGGEPVPRAD